MDESESERKREKREDWRGKTQHNKTSQQILLDAQRGCNQILVLFHIGDNDDDDADAATVATIIAVCSFHLASLSLSLPPSVSFILYFFASKKWLISLIHIGHMSYALYVHGPIVAVARFLSPSSIAYQIQKHCTLPCPIHIVVYLYRNRCALHFYSFRFPLSHG